MRKRPTVPSSLERLRSNSDLWLPRSELMETASVASRLVEIVKIVVVQ